MDKKRLINFLKKLGFKNDEYLELYAEIDNNPYQLWYFKGNDFIIADDLARWGFLKKIISPIVKNDSYLGNNIYFAHIKAQIKIDNNQKEPF